MVELNVSYSPVTFAVFAPERLTLLMGRTYRSPPICHRLLRQTIENFVASCDIVALFSARLAHHFFVRGRLTACASSAAAIFAR